MPTLVNNTKHKVQFYAAGCTPETGVIEAGGSVKVEPQGDVVEVVFGGYSGTGEAPVRAWDVRADSTVTLSVTVENSQS